MSPHAMHRREFLKILGSGAICAAAAACGISCERHHADKPADGAMPRRTNPIADDGLAPLNDCAPHGLIPCTGCQCCMPCPYGIDIPGVFEHYNKCVNDGNAPSDTAHPNFAHVRRAFLVSYDRSVPKARQADRCISCGRCIDQCPMQIMIPRELAKIADYTQRLKKS